MLDPLSSFHIKLSTRWAPQLVTRALALAAVPDPSGPAGPAAAAAAGPGQRYTVTLKRPLGLVLEEITPGRIVVSEIIPGGNADKSGQVRVGDELVATSALVYTTRQQYGEVAVRGGEEIVRLAVRGESFKTVMAAISTNHAHRPPVLEFLRPR